MLILCIHLSFVHTFHLTTLNVSFISHLLIIFCDNIVSIHNLRSVFLETAKISSICLNTIDTLIVVHNLDSQPYFLLRIIKDSEIPRLYRKNKND